MNNFPCVSDFKNPHDEPAEHAHCSGIWNVTVRGVNADVDFDCVEPSVWLDHQEVTHILANPQEFIDAAVKAYKEAAYEI